jgi:cyclase
MIKKRIIPKILLGTSIKSGKIISGTTLKYDTFRITGAPESQAQIYQQTLSDELMIIAPRNQIILFLDLISCLTDINNKIFMPLSFGGGLKTEDEVKTIFDLGIEKVIFGRSLHENPDLIEKTANTYGAQSVVVSIDFKDKTTNSKSISHDTSISYDFNFEDAIRKAENLGAGEISLNCVTRDGTMQGTNIESLSKARKLTQLPIIQGCGVGSTSHFIDAFNSGADAVAVGTYFAFLDQNFIQIRSHIRNSEIDIRI